MRLNLKLLILTLMIIGSFGRPMVSSTEDENQLSTESKSTESDELTTGTYSKDNHILRIDRVQPSEIRLPTFQELQTIIAKTGPSYIEKDQSQIEKDKHDIESFKKQLDADIRRINEDAKLIAQTASKTAQEVVQQGKEQAEREIEQVKAMTYGEIMRGLAMWHLANEKNYYAIEKEPLRNTNKPEIKDNYVTASY